MVKSFPTFQKLLYLVVGVFVALSLSFSLVASTGLKLTFLFAFIFCWSTVLLHWTRYKSTLIHPFFIYRYLILLTMIFQSHRLANSLSGYKEETLFVILVSAIIFIYLLDLFSNFISNKYPIENADTHDVEKKAQTIFLSLFVLGWIWRLYAIKKQLLFGTFLATGLEVTAYSNLLGQFNNLAFVGFVGFLVFKKQMNRFLFFLMLPMELFWMFLAGSKAGVIYVLVPVLVIFYKKKKLTVLFKNIFLSFLLFFLVYFSFRIISNYRYFVQSSQTLSESQQGSLLIEILYDSFVNFDYESFSPTDESLLDRINWAEYFAQLYERKDLWKKSLLGKTLLPAALWWIPRALWSDKPGVSVGRWYAENVLGWEGNDRGEGAITLWGDALINFGYGGLILFPVLWLLFVGLLWEYTIRQGNWGVVVLALVYVRLLLGLEQNIANPIVSIQQTILIVYIIKIISKVRLKL